MIFFRDFVGKDPSVSGTQIAKWDLLNLDVQQRYVRANRPVLRGNLGLVHWDHSPIGLTCVGFENFESLTRSNNEPMLRKVLDCSIVQWRGLDMLGVSYATIRS